LNDHHEHVYLSTVEVGQMECRAADSKGGILAIGYYSFAFGAFGEWVNVSHG
jgi:hypothetical protein